MKLTYYLSQKLGYAPQKQKMMLQLEHLLLKLTHSFMFRARMEEEGVWQFSIEED